MSFLSHKIRSLPKLILKELPVLLFFVFLAHIWVVAWSIPDALPDMIYYYDQWWYLHQRLIEGQIAQWNPFNLNGTIAVNWNHVPFSMFTPFLMKYGPSLDSFYICRVIGSFACLASIYIAGRILKYNRVFSLIPVVVLGTNSMFVTRISSPAVATFYTFYPLALAVLIYPLLKNKSLSATRWLLGTVLLAISFLGLRIEYVFNVTCFILLASLVYALAQSRIFEGIGRFVQESDFQNIKTPPVLLSGNPQRIKTFFIFTLLTLTIIIAANIWHLIFPLNSMLDLNRVSMGFHLAKLMSPIFIKFVFVSIIFQASFILLVVNLALLVFPVIFSKLRKFLTLDLNLKIVSLVIGVELLVYVLAVILQHHYGEWMLNFFSINKIGLAPGTVYIEEYLQKKGVESFKYVIPSVLICAVSHFLRGSKSTVRNLLFFLMAVSAGTYLTEAISFYPLSYHVRLPEFWVNCLIVPLGTLALFQKKRGWVVWVLVLHQFIGETGIFFAQEIFGVQFVNIRIMPLRFPLYIVLLIESVLLAIETVPLLLSRITKNLSLEFSEKVIRPRVNFVFVVGSLVFVFWGIQSNLFSYYGERGMPNWTAAQRFLVITNAIQNHNKNDRFVHKPPFSEAQNNSDTLRSEYKGKKNHFERVYVGSDEVGEKLNAPRFFPSYFQQLNTFYFYSASDMPSNFVSMYLRGGDRGLLSYEVSREGPLVFRIFRFMEHFYMKIQTNGSYDFSVIRPHASYMPEKFAGELLAEEGSGVPRAFIAEKVTKLDGQKNEFNYILNDVLRSGKSITTEITTSDESFEPVYPVSGTNSIQSNIEFKQDKPEYIVLETTSDGNGYLVLLDTHSPGWRALIDGNEVPIYRGYIGTRFIPLAHGKHTVEFIYALPGFAIAKIISLLTWICIGLFVICLLVRSRFWFKIIPSCNV